MNEGGRSFQGEGDPGEVDQGGSGTTAPLFASRPRTPLPDGRLAQALTVWIPIFGLASGLIWLISGFIPPSVVEAPPTWVELELIPGLLGVLFLLAAGGLILSRGAAVLCWLAAAVLGFQLLNAVLLLGFLYSLRDF